jgi:hypothetical protein
MFNDDTTLGQLGGEFQKMQMLDRDRGLIDPTIRSNYTNRNDTDTINLAGVDTGIILQGNQNPSEELYQTDAQAALYLSRALGDARPVTQTDREVELYEDHDLDPRLRQEVLDEAARYGSNMFSLQSQDFVKTIQDDIKGYYDETNLYFQQVPFTQTREGLIRDFTSGLDISKGRGAEDLINEYFMNQIVGEALETRRRKAEDIKRAKERRERFVPKSKVKTTEEKLRAKQGATPTPTPTFTPRGPRATPTPTATPTAYPTMTPSPTPTPTPSATPAQTSTRNFWEL